MIKIFKNGGKFFVLFLIVMYVVSSHAAPAIMKPDGFAAGVTGGGNASPQVVKSMSELNKLAGGSSPAVIIVEGKLSGKVTIGSNKTIIGANSSSGMSGFSSSGSNNIIQNLSFGPSSGDVAEVRGGKNFFITKCEFHDCGDELLSMVGGCDNITISWCKFYFDKPHAHAFGHLIGSSDNDKGQYHTTFHHNWYSKGVVERMPRVRFGTVHIYNNFYDSDNTNYVVGVGVNATILLEGSYFKDQGTQTFYDWRNGKTATIQWTDDNIFAGTSQASSWATNGQAFKPPYEYKLDKTEDIPAIVSAGAGNVIGNSPVHLVNFGMASQKSNIDAVYSNNINPEVVFNLDKESDMRITLHDNMGRTVAKILNRAMSAGSHSVTLNQSSISKGIYYLKLQTNEASQLLKICYY